jgi:hypothetical protein
MGTWKLKPGGWQPLPVDEREKIAQMAAETDNCTHDVSPKTEYSDTICIVLLSELHAGGHDESGERITWPYVAKNLARLRLRPTRRVIVWLRSPVHDELW